MQIQIGTVDADPRTLDKRSTFTGTTIQVQIDKNCDVKKIKTATSKNLFFCWMLQRQISMPITAMCRRGMRIIFYQSLLLWTACAAQLPAHLTT